MARRRAGRGVHGGMPAAVAALALLAGACGRSAPAGPRTVQVYFARPDSCAVQPFVREVPGGEPLEVVRQALEALLAGPTAEEAAQGFLSAIPDTLEVRRHRMRYMVFDYDAPHDGQRVAIRSLEPMAGGVLRVDFSREINAYDHGAVRVCTIVRQVRDTVTQFPEWKAVSIAVDGETRGILQP